MIKSVNIIGAGNVATHLVKAISAHAGMLRAVYARNLEKANELAAVAGIGGVAKISELPLADLTIIAVKDDAIEGIVEQLNPDFKVVHVSGSKPLELLDKFSQKGILYPLQTFSTKRELDVHKIPFFIEVVNDEFKAELHHFCAACFSENIHYANSHQRATIHLAAVLASNFSNHLLAEAQTILETENLPFSILEPLMVETLRKSFDLEPRNAQTGPAVRNDTATLTHQINALPDEDLKLIYHLISKRIQHRPLND